MPDLGFKDWTIVAARLRPKELQSLQELARHYRGKKTQFSKLSRDPGRKILRGVFDDIESAKSGPELARGMIHEHKQHKHDPDFHKGGGLYDGSMALMSNAWNYATAYVEPLAWIQDAVDWAWGYRHEKDVPKTVRERVDLNKQAKKKEGSRKDSMHGWVLDREASSGRVAVYVDDNEKEVHTCVRGTDKQNASDLMEDAKIIWTGSPDSEEVKKTLMEVAAKYTDYDLDTLGYSLGGSMLTNVFATQSEEEKALLDRYEDVVLVNPGGSTFGPTDQIENVLNQDRTTLLANRSDIISGIYQQYANKDRTYYGKRTYDWLRAHDDEQFGTESPDWTDEKPGVTNQEAMANVGL